MSADPYGSLDPRPGARLGDEPLFPEVGVAATLLRGLRKRCPRCAARDVFRSWFELKPLCTRCGLRFEAEEGGFLGAMVLNYTLAIGMWLVVMAVGLVLTVPDVPVWPLLISSLVVLVPLPVWFYPRSKITWAAVEFLVARSAPEYRPPVKRDPRARELE